MRTSIFDLEIRVDVYREFRSLCDILKEENALCYGGKWYDLYDFLNDVVFPIWEDKGLFIDLDDFLEKIGLDFENDVYDVECLLYLLEALVNLWPIANDMLDFVNYGRYFSNRVLGYMDLYIFELIENLNYTVVDKNGRKIITKRDSDVDSILDVVPINCAELLLKYNDIRSNNLASKLAILKELDKFIEEEKSKYKSLSAETYNSIQTIINKMGVNHPRSEEPFKSFTQGEVIDWYDKCFKLMIHLIRQKEVNEINKERKELVGD